MQEKCVLFPVPLTFHTLTLSLQPQSSLMDLMDVPEPGARADPWGTGAVSRAAAVAEDPWQSYGTSARSASRLRWERSRETSTRIDIYCVHVCFSMAALGLCIFVK